MFADTNAASINRERAPSEHDGSFIAGCAGLLARGPNHGAAKTDKLNPMLRIIPPQDLG